jgi:ATP-dependent 26S proteasome regulatory subunit
VVNVLLNLLEDYESPGLLIATTNIETTIDTALFRRFDDIIEIPKPGKKETIKLLKNTLSSMNFSKKIIWDELAVKMKNFSAALIVKIANDAAKTAVLQNSKIVENEHLLAALSENFKYKK